MRGILLPSVFRNWNYWSKYIEDATTWALAAEVVVFLPEGQDEYSRSEFPQKIYSNAIFYLPCHRK